MLKINLFLIKYKMKCHFKDCTEKATTFFNSKSYCNSHFYKIKRGYTEQNKKCFGCKKILAIHNNSGFCKRCYNKSKNYFEDKK